MTLAPRQIHLDFHTSEAIPDIAANFDPRTFAETARKAAVSSITVFARCHHGWLYYPSKRFPELIHPNLKNHNLLLEQVRKLTNVKSQIVFAMESTAHYWLALYARLLKDGYTVIVLNPIQSHSLRELYIRKTKTDAKDS